MGWTKAEFKDGEVWAECDASGRLRKRSGKVRIAYRPNAKKLYSTFEDRLRVIDPTQVEEWGNTSGKSKNNSEVLGGTAADLEEAAHLHLWSDGACTGNPGPSGAGTVLIDGDDVREWSTWLGQGTNNIAELTAVLQGLRAIPSPVERTVVVHSDSQYSIGVLARGWKAKANGALIGEIKEELERFPRVVWHWVRGHDGVELNERCDRLAREAIANRASREG